VEAGRLCFGIVPGLEQFWFHLSRDFRQLWVGHLGIRGSPLPGLVAVLGAIPGSRNCGTPTICCRPSGPRMHYALQITRRASRVAAHVTPLHLLKFRRNEGTLLRQIKRENTRRMAREQQAREEILKGKAAYANKPDLDSASLGSASGR
jgi:hypothetical protein